MRGPSSSAGRFAGPRETLHVALIFVAALTVIAGGWVIFSTRTMSLIQDCQSTHQQTEAVFLAAGRQETERGEVSGETGAEPVSTKEVGVLVEGHLGPAPGDPEGCQTVVFFHVPKTGGESLNDLWIDKAARQRLVGWDAYRRIRIITGMAFEGTRPMTSMTPWLGLNARERHHLLELHCGTTTSFMQAQDALASMRADHERNQCGFFAFTVVRQPLEWVVSLYDDICHRRLHGHKDTCPQKEGMTSKEEMLTYPHADGTVSYLKHGWKGWDSPGPVDEADVEPIFKALRSHLDLVAFTEEVPELRHYLTKRFAAIGGSLTPDEEAFLGGNSVHNANTRKTVYVSDFSPDELQQLNATIQLDWELYRLLKDAPRSW